MKKTSGFRVSRDIPCQMRDGVNLYSDIYIPDDGVNHYPVLLMRTPYDKRHAETMTYNHPSWYARRGYMVVVQDTRGRWSSEGSFIPFVQEEADGFDTVEWAAKLPYSNGRVGMYGFSYVGATQLQAALQQPSNLVAIAPAFTGSNFYDGWAYRGGAFSLAFNIGWAIELALDTARKAGLDKTETELFSLFDHAPDLYAYLPLSNLDKLQNWGVTPYFDAWVQHENYDDYWQSISIEKRYEKIQVPAFHIGGWYDIFLEGTIRNYENLNSISTSPQYLHISPWTHQQWNRHIGEIDFGEYADNIIDDVQLKWFDYWLKGDQQALIDVPRVRVFTMGTNRYRTAETWPIPGTKFTPLYLHSKGTANSLRGDGRLSFESPAEEPQDIYVYDPRQYVASLGGRSCCFPSIAPMGPVNQWAAEVRNDVLVYTTDILEKDMEITGPVESVVYAATTATDTDFTMKLVDVHGDGTAINICDGIIRARYRNSLEHPTAVVPDERMKLNISLGSTSIVIPAGHRIRVEVSSSNFPAYGRNPNQFIPVGTAQYNDFTVATQTIFHDDESPSHIIIPFIEK